MCSKSLCITPEAVAQIIGHNLLQYNNQTKESCDLAVVLTQIHFSIMMTENVLIFYN